MNIISFRGLCSRTAFASVHSMICTLVLVALSIGIARGQSDPAHEYNFRQQSVTDGQAYNNNGDPVPILTMDCLAANGYGQWTLSSILNTGIWAPINGPAQPEWDLLANGLYAPSMRFDPNDKIKHPGCIPPGLVQQGPITDGIPQHAKNVANLTGWVAYVWPDPGNPSLFQIREFGPSDVDISLGILANPTPPMNIVINPMQSYTASLGTLAIDNSEMYWNDEFDLAINASNLFITCKTSLGFIAVIVVPLGHSSTAIPAMAPAPAERPTIACDIRATDDNYSLEWLTGHQLPTDDIILASGNTTAIGPLVPLGVPQLKHVASPCPGPWSFPLHARVLQSSGTDRDPNVAVYALVHSAGTILVLFDPQYAPSAADVVDDGNCPALARPMPAPAGATTCGIVDAPIVAFADPYDNQATGTLWDHMFHCLYQLNYQTPGGPVRPIVIVRGQANGYWPNSLDTRLVLNQGGGLLLANPIAHPNSLSPQPYVAAINQMGIHVHWHAYDNNGNIVHYYSRDMNRTFDENIEENTGLASIS